MSKTKFTRTVDIEGTYEVCDVAMHLLKQDVVSVLIVGDRFKLTVNGKEITDVTEYYTEKEAKHGK